MKALLLLLALALPACSDAAPASPPEDAQPLEAAGSPLRALTGAQAQPGPEGEDPPCTAFAPQATCTRVGDVVWVLQADGGSWQLTGWTPEEQRWTATLQGSGGGMSPLLSEADLTDADQPETLVVYGGGFDVVSSLDADAPRVVVHGEGQASVEDGQVVAGERQVTVADGRWVSVPR